MQDERTAQRAVPTNIPTRHFSISDSFHIKELREF
jgi:hypothetical protein